MDKEQQINNKKSLAMAALIGGVIVGVAIAIPEKSNELPPDCVPFVQKEYMTLDEFNLWIDLLNSSNGLAEFDTIGCKEMIIKNANDALADTTFKGDVYLKDVILTEEEANAAKEILTEKFDVAKGKNTEAQDVKTDDLQKM